MSRKLILRRLGTPNCGVDRIESGASFWYARCISSVGMHRGGPRYDTASRSHAGRGSTVRGKCGIASCWCRWQTITESNYAVLAFTFVQKLTLKSVDDDHLDIVKVGRVQSGCTKAACDCLCDELRCCVMYNGR